MFLSEFSDKLEWLANNGIYAHSNTQFRSYFPGEGATNLKKTIERALIKGVLLRPCRGVYLTAKRLKDNVYKLESIALVLRRGEYSYVSLETALSQYSIISQMTVNYLSVMTTGRSQIYRTPFGTIEFTHTARNEIDILENTYKQGERPMRVAKPDLALSDLKRVGRNLNLVDMDTYEEVVYESHFVN
ncbi:MAG: hypothetical protein HRT35_01415 [Algicola sp.]|nr:hypothetical protein [Algicola sp.]